MKNTRTRNTAFISTISVFVVVCIGLIIWWFCIDPGDAFGYSLLAMYLILPVTECMCALFAGRTDSKLKWAVPVLFFTAETAFFYIVWGDFELFYLILFSLFPSLLGLGVGIGLKQLEKGESSRKHKIYAVLLTVVLVVIIVLLLSNVVVGASEIAYASLTLVLLPFAGLIISLIAGQSDNKFKWIVPVIFTGIILCTPRAHRNKYSE